MFQKGMQKCILFFYDLTCCRQHNKLFFMRNKENGKIEQLKVQEKDIEKYLKAIVFVLAVCNILVYISLFFALR